MTGFGIIKLADAENALAKAKKGAASVRLAHEAYVKAPSLLPIQSISLSSDSSCIAVAYGSAVYLYSTSDILTKVCIKREW